MTQHQRMNCKGTLRPAAGSLGAKHLLLLITLSSKPKGTVQIKLEATAHENSSMMILRLTTMTMFWRRAQMLWGLKRT